VEEMAAAASSLKSQAQDLVQVVAAFKLNDAEGAGGLPKVSMRSAAPKILPSQDTQRRALGKSGPQAQRTVASAKVAPPRKPATTAAAPAALPKPSPKPAPASGDDEWETF